MDITISWIGALIGLALAIILILFRLTPTYSLIIGAVIGALVGGASLAETVTVIISGTESVMGTAIRVLSAGIFAGVMMESGAAETLAQFIVKKLGGSKVILALSLATMIITGVGVFVPVAVLIVAPIAISVGNKMGYSKIGLLVALSGGGKAGNIISPNPNTIAAASGFGLDVNQVMIAGFIPAVFGLIVTVFLASRLKKTGTMVTDKEAKELEKDTSDYPILSKSLVAPVLAIVLLMLSPIGSLIGVPFLEELQIDSLYILPLAGLVGTIVMGKKNELLDYCSTGLDRMTPTVLIVIGAGAIGGLIAASDLSVQVISLIDSLGISGVFLAPIAGILMGGATASTSTGVILATGSFGDAILGTGVSPLSASVMVHSGATVIDALPHGGYFHVTRHSFSMDFSDRMRVFGYEVITGLVMTLVATILYGFIL